MRHYLQAKTRSETKSAGGMVIASWVHAFYLYAAMETDKTVEGFSGLLPSARTNVNFTSWIRDDLLREMRIVFDGEEYDIISVSKGFKTMSFECQRVNP